VGALSGNAPSIPDGALELHTLDQLPGVGPVSVRRPVERFGTAAAVLQAPKTAFAEVAGAAAARARTDVALRNGAEHVLRRAERLGIVVRSWDSPDYPDGLRHLTDPPPALFCRGRLELLGRERSVTIVGARKATSRGRDTAEKLGLALARAGATVVSGLALGIDGAAYVGMLRGGGPAVAGSGQRPGRRVPPWALQALRADMRRGTPRE